MTTGQMSFSEALARAEAAIRARAPGFKTLTTGQKRIAVLQQAIRDAGGEPVGPSFPNPADEPRVIDALETQLRNLQRAADVAAPYNRLLIEAAAPELNISDDLRLLATEGGASRQDPAPRGTAQRQPDRPAQPPESQPFAPVILGQEEQVSGQAAFRDPAPDPAMRERAVALQQKLRELGFTPVVEGHIPLREAAVAVIRLTNQLNAVLDPEREARIAPQEFSSTSDAALQAPLAPVQPPAAEPSAPPPDVDPRHTAYIITLQDRVRAAGSRPEFTGAVTSENVFGAITMLENQLERLRAVESARKELEESAVALDVLDLREREIMALQQAIRDYGDVPVVRGDVRPDNYSTTIMALNQQLREIVSRPNDFNSSGFNTGPFSTDAQSMGGPNEDRSFFQSLTQPGPAEQAWELEAQEEAEREAQETRERELLAVWREHWGTTFEPAPGFMTVIEAYRKIEPLFAPGELAPLLLDLLTNPGFSEWSVEEQTLHFLKTANENAGLGSSGFHHEDTPEEQLDWLLSRLEGGARHGVELRAQEPQTIGDIWPDLLRVGAAILDWSGNQWVPDSVAEDLPDYARIPVQAALNLTAPINFAMLFAGGAGAANVGREVVGEVVGGSLGQIAEDQGWPVELQIFLEVLGGVLGSNIGPELADAGARSLAPIAREITGELLEAPEDSVKFARLIREGRLDEAYGAVKENLIDDAGDVAGAARFDEFRGRILIAAIDNGLTEEQQLQMELAKGIITEMVEEYDRPEHGSSFDTRTREPFPFGLVIDDQYAEFLRTRITKGTGLYGDQPELALNGLGRFLAGDEPSEDQYRAIEAAFGPDFVLDISKAAQEGLLRPNETDVRP